MFFQNLWRCHEQLSQAPLYHPLAIPAISFQPCSKSPELVNFVPESDCIDLTESFHVHACGCSTRCTCEVGPKPHLLQALCLHKTCKMQVHPQELGNRASAARPHALRQGEGLPRTDLAAPTGSKLCRSSMSHSSSSPAYLRSPESGGQPVGTASVLQAGVPLVSLTSYLKMRQPSLQTRLQFLLNDWLFLN